MMGCCNNKACFILRSYNNPASSAGPRKYELQRKSLTVSDNFILRGAEAGWNPNHLLADGARGSSPDPHSVAVMRRQQSCATPNIYTP
jgi:hypothetical protein